MKRYIFPGLLLFLLIPPASGLGMEAGQGRKYGEYEQLFVESCELWKVPLKLALAIARQESGLNPWAVNVAGQGYIFRTREEALRVVDAAWRAGYSFDVGLMQINSYWMRRFRLDPHMVLEPRKNIIFGVWILSKEIERFGLTWQAVASYHTPLDRNPERGRNYAASVIRLIQMTPNKKEGRPLNAQSVFGSEIGFHDHLVSQWATFCSASILRH